MQLSNHMLLSIETYLRYGMRSMRGPVLADLMCIVSTFPYERLPIAKVEDLLLEMERIVFRGSRTLRRKVYQIVGKCLTFWK